MRGLYVMAGALVGAGLVRVGVAEPGWCMAVISGVAMTLIAAFHDGGST
jgi:hypothetical protein